MNKIIIINPYFGKLPSWFPLWLKSVKVNDTIHWLIITDDQSIFTTPENVSIKYSSFDELKKTIDRKLGLKTNITHPYKLCEFRPAYGLIFSEFIEGYDFWGNCDLDMIFGDINRFITENILLSYTKIQSNGHFTLYKNTPEVNKYFMLPSVKVDYNKIFLSESYFNFEEWKGIHQVLAENKIPQFYELFFADIIPDRKKFLIGSKMDYPVQAFLWENGNIFQVYFDGTQINKKEFAYIHFQKRFLPAFQFDPAITNSFFITPDGFIPWDIDKKITVSDLKAFNKDQSGYRLYKKIKGAKKQFKKYFFK